MGKPEYVQRAMMQFDGFCSLSNFGLAPAGLVYHQAPGEHLDLEVAEKGEYFVVQFDLSRDPGEIYQVFIRLDKKGVSFKQCRIYKSGEIHVLGDPEHIDTAFHMAKRCSGFIEDPRKMTSLISDEGRRHELAQLQRDVRELAEIYRKMDYPMDM